MLFALLQYLIPQHALSRLIGKLAQSRNSTVKSLFISYFAKQYQIKLDDYEADTFDEFESFNAFFTRAIKPEARPIDNDPSALVSPADGVVSELGPINQQMILQAKGVTYSVDTLLGQLPEAVGFYGGQFCTIYLSPSDYHRVHMPFTARVTRSRYVPGSLFSVNQSSAEHIPKLFARNERLVCLFDLDYADKSHKVAVVLVGAMIVAGIESVLGNNAPSKKIQDMNHDKQFDKGDELGRFYLGSTAIVLLPPTLPANFLSELSPGSTVRMGQKIAELIYAANPTDPTTDQAAT